MTCLGGAGDAGREEPGPVPPMACGIGSGGRASFRGGDVTGLMMGRERIVQQDTSVGGTGV